MDAVPEPNRAIGNAWCYGIGQSILVDKIKKNPKLGKSKNKIARKGKPANKLVKNSSKTEGRKKRGFTEGSSTTTSREARSNSRSARKKNMTRKNPTLLQKLKDLAAEAEDDEEIVFDLIPQADPDNNDESRDYITTNSTVIKFLICQTGYNSPTIVHSLAKVSRKKYRYNKKVWVRLEKKEYENDVVWITLQARQFRWKKVNIPTVKGDGTDAMSIFYDNTNNREKFCKLDTVKDIEKQQHMCQLLSCSLQSLSQSSVARKNFMGVAQNCEIIGRAKGQGRETSCPPYY